MVFVENKWKILLAVSAIAIIAAALLASISNVTVPPRIQVRPASFDFGEMEPLAVEQAFSLKNVGGMPLKILKISTSCGCTTAWADSETVQPGEETVLHVKFDPNAMPEAVAGKVLRVVYLKSNDPETPELEIEITANVKGVGS